MSFDEIDQLACCLAEKYKNGGFLGLIGDLGTGKTTMTKKICAQLGVTEHIKSPTFTYVIEYLTSQLKINHFDVYRLTSDDIYEIGFEDYLSETNSLSIIEWADNIITELPEDTLYIEFLHYDEKSRKISVYQLKNGDKIYVDICINNNN